MAADAWVTFDCFGTLIDWRRGLRAILEPLAGARTEALIAAYQERAHVLEAERPHRRYRDVLTTGLADAARAIGLDLTAPDALARHWGSLPLFEDVPAGLAVLRAEGWKIGVLTNCDDDLFAATLAANQALAPDLVITAEQVGSYKPAHGHWQAFARRTGVAHADWVHAANSWVHDIAPARDLGLARVWVDRYRTGHDPAAASRVIAGMAELPAAARGLRAASAEQ
jgi:2-haloacid dehalogenase